MAKTTIEVAAMGQSSKSSEPDRRIDFSPRGWLISYPLLVDLCLQRFIEDFSEDFKATKDGRFKLKKSLSAAALKELMASYLDESISSVLSKALDGLPLAKNDWIIVADSGSDRRVSYEMVEKDIDIGLEKIVRMLEALFNRSMRSRQRDAQTIWCKHRLLLAEDWAKVCKKKVFGRDHFTTVLSGQKKPRVVREVVSNEKVSALSKSEQTVAVKEAAGWIFSQLSSSR